MTRVLPASNDYSPRDFDGYKDRLVRALKSVFPTWSDYAIANFGNLLVEQGCDVGDILDVYHGNLSREAFLLTATRRLSVRLHAKKLGYTMAGPSAAQVDLLFTLSATTIGDVLFLAGDIVRAESATEPARVQLLSDLTILAGNLTGNVTAENALTHIQYHQSDEAADQEIPLDLSPFLGVGTITDSMGAAAQVESFLDSTSTDFHYIVLSSEGNRGLVRFGDGRNGRVPVAGETAVTYKTWGGQINIEAGSLTRPEFTKRDTDGNQVYFTVTNQNDATPGSTGETIEEVKLKAPLAYAAGKNSVNGPDFVINALRVPGIARALMLTSDQDAGIRENHGQLRLVARGSQLASGYYAPTTPTQAQIDLVRSTIENNYPPTLTFTFDPLAADFLTVNITARFNLQEGASAATADAAIRAAYGNFFAVSDPNSVPTSTVKFGAEYVDEEGVPEHLIAWSDLFDIVRDASGVRKIDKDDIKFTVGGQDYYDDIPVLTTQFPKLGTVTLINARTGLALV